MTSHRLTTPPTRSAGWSARRGMMDTVNGEGFSKVLAAARRRDEMAWRILFRMVSGRVVGFLVARGCADPEDVAGEVFADMVQAIRRFRGDERAFISWTLTIAHRRLVDAWRTSSRRPQTVADDQVLVQVPADTAGAALGLVAAAEARRLLAQLTPDQADVVTLRIYGDLTLPEVARHLGKPLTAVTALQHRALERLRRLLDGTSEPD